MKAVAELARYE